MCRVAGGGEMDDDVYSKRIDEDSSEAMQGFSWVKRFVQCRRAARRAICSSSAGVLCMRSPQTVAVEKEGGDVSVSA